MRAPASVLQQSMDCPAFAIPDRKDIIAAVRVPGVPVPGLLPKNSERRNHLTQLIMPRRRQLLFAFYMSGVMSLLMSGVITLINTGVDPGLPGRWAGAWIIAWAVVYPLVFFISPFAGRLTDATLRLLDRRDHREPGDGIR